MEKPVWLLNIEQHRDTAKLRWFYDQNFTLYFSGVSHRSPRKDKNALYCLQISAYVPEIFVFRK